MQKKNRLNNEVKEVNIYLKYIQAWCWEEICEGLGIYSEPDWVHIAWNFTPLCLFSFWPGYTSAYWLEPRPFRGKKKKFV